jgi:hypothetical protein
MSKNSMAWSCRKNTRHRNSEKYAAWKAICDKTKRKTKNEITGRRVRGSEKDGCQLDGGTEQGTKKLGGVL